jgi:ABC-type molybdate transport system substrate-binding protein
MVKIMGRFAAIAAFFFAQASFATASEIKVFSTIGVQAALEELASKFEKETGNKLNITWGTAAILVKKIQSARVPICWC